MRQVIRVIKTPVTLIILLAILGYGAMWGFEHATISDTRKAQACVAMSARLCVACRKVNADVAHWRGLPSITKLLCGFWTNPLMHLIPLPAPG